MGISLIIITTGLFATTFGTQLLDSEEYLRQRRQINSLPLVYPYGGTYKFIIGFSSPVESKDNIALSFSGNIQYQYTQFMNISELSQYYFTKEVSRKEREAELIARREERLVFYKSMEDLLTAKGFNGPDCMLRAICEAAQYPVEEEGLVGEVLHALLTPDYGRSLFDTEEPEWEDAMATYRDAAIAGRQMFSCRSIYSGCPEVQNIIGFFSLLRDE